MKRQTLYLLAVGALTLSLRAQQDDTLARVSANFASEKQAIETTQLATYADQLEALRQSFLSQQNTVAADQVATEYKSVVDQLKALQLKALAPEPKPMTTADKALEDIFGSNPNPDQDRPVRTKSTAILRPGTAESSPADLPPREFWSHAKAAQKWTLTDLAPGKYKVRLEFRAKKGESGGTGQLELTGNETPIPFRILSQEEDGKKIQSQDIALLEIEKCPVDLTIRVTSHAIAETPLFSLVAVWVQPAGSPDDPAPKPRAADPADPVKGQGEPPRKKVDF